MTAPLDRLSGLQRDVAQFWSESAHRNSMLDELVRAWLDGDERYLSIIGIIDDAIAQLLAALALPRGEVSRVRIETGVTGWRGRKTPTCELLLSAEDLVELVSRRQYDSVLKTWIHESLHARLPFAATALAESRAFRGYEEGMVEGLSRYVLTSGAEIALPHPTWDRYVAGYEQLALSIGVEPSTIWRALWQFPTGRIRSEFAQAIGQLCEEHAGLSFTTRQRMLLLASADRIFATNTLRYTRDTGELLRTWKRAFS